MLSMRFVALLVGLAVSVAALGQKPRDRALVGARQLADAIVALDAETVVRLTAPKFRQALGGESRMLEIVRQQFQKGRQAGVAIQSVQLGQPTEIGVDGQRQFLFVPYQVLATSPTQRVTDAAYYLAISEDGGTTWHFVDGIQLDAEVLKYFLPMYSGDPPLPERSRKVEPLQP